MQIKSYFEASIAIFIFISFASSVMSKNVSVEVDQASANAFIEILTTNNLPSRLSSRLNDIRKRRAQLARSLGLPKKSLLSYAAYKFKDSLESSLKKESDKLAEAFKGRSDFMNLKHLEEARERFRAAAKIFVSNFEAELEKGIQQLPTLIAAQQQEIDIKQAKLPALLPEEQYAAKKEREELEIEKNELKRKLAELSTIDFKTLRKKLETFVTTIKLSVNYVNQKGFATTIKTKELKCQLFPKPKSSYDYLLFRGRLVIRDQDSTLIRDRIRETGDIFNSFENSEPWNGRDEFDKEDYPLYYSDLSSLIYGDYNISDCGMVLGANGHRTLMLQTNRRTLI